MWKNRKHFLISTAALWGCSRMDKITFTLPEQFPLLNVQQRRHFRTRGKMKISTARQIIALLGAERPAEPFQKARVTVTRYSSGSPDRDGLYGGVKDLLDCLTTPSPQANGKVRNKYGIGLIVDDSPAHIELDVRAERCRRAEQRTEVVVEALA